MPPCSKYLPARLKLLRRQTRLRHVMQHERPAEDGAVPEYEPDTRSSKKDDQG